MSWSGLLLLVEPQLTLPLKILSLHDTISDKTVNDASIVYIHMSAALDFFHSFLLSWDQTVLRRDLSHLAQDNWYVITDRKQVIYCSLPELCSQTVSRSGTTNTTT